jgi:hypothetical protein
MRAKLKAGALGKGDESLWGETGFQGTCNIKRGGDRVSSHNFGGQGRMEYQRETV